MARWIRNCRLPGMPAADWGASDLAFFMREAFRTGLWTEFANDGDAAWTAAVNHIFTDDTGTPGFAVLAANSREVTHSGGPFTQAMVDNNYVLALVATNDQNASMWRISEYIDANTVKVDPMGFSPYGWTDESGIPGRILDYGGDRIPDAGWVQMDPPSGNNRVNLTITQATGLLCAVQPKAGLGDFTQSPTNGMYMYDDDDYDITLNAYFDGNNALFWKFADNDGRLDIVMFGELDGAVPQDTWPGFVWCTHSSAFPAYPHIVRTDMLGPQSITIQSFTNWIVRNIWTADGSTNLDQYLYYRLINGAPGFARLRVPWVTLGNTAGNGAFPRGKLPVVRFGTNQLANYSPVDARGHWWHLRGGIFVPRNGPFDPSILTSYT